MIREILRPTSRKLTYNLPKEYINKEIEIIIFPFTETISTVKKHKQNRGFIDNLASKPISVEKKISFFTREEANER